MNVFHASLDKKRFSENRDILSSLDVFTPSAIMKRSIHNLEEKLDTICAFYGKDQDNSTADIDGDVLVSEFEFWRKHVQSNSSEVLPAETRKPSTQQLFAYLYQTGIANILPNVYQMYQIIYTIPATSVEPERSFSKLCIIKSYRRAMMGQDRLSGLAVLSIERKLAECIDFDEVIHIFAEKRE